MSHKNTHGGRRDNHKRRSDDKRGGVRVPGPGKKLGRPRKDKAMTIQENTIVTEQTVFGPRDVRVLTVNKAFNTAVVQFRDLDKTPSEQNTYSTVLDKLKEK